LAICCRPAMPCYHIGAAAGPAATDGGDGRAGRDHRPLMTRSAPSPSRITSGSAATPSSSLA
jgi:hypothetical protein